MLVKLYRDYPDGDSIFGRLWVDGKSYCDTLEPTLWAIPAGFYRLRLTMSPRFGEILPLLDNVVGREGIRIHPGNRARDSHGCILVGERDMTCARLLCSRRVFEQLREDLQAYHKEHPKEEMYIAIDDPDPYPLAKYPCPKSEWATRNW